MPLRRSDFLSTSAGAIVAAAASATPADAQALQSIRTLTFPSDAIKQILYPAQAGIFRKSGVQLEMSTMGSGAAIVAALVGGSADIGSASLFPAFTAFGHGIPIRIIAPIAIYDSARCDTWMLVLKESKLHGPRDLNGTVTAADSPSDINVYATRVWMDANGGDGKSLKAVGIPAAEQLNALYSGRIDTVMLKPPFLTVALQSGKVRALGKPLDVIAPKFLLSCWVATTDFMEKHPDLVKAFVEGAMAGSKYANAHEDATVDMVAQFTKQDPAQIRAGVRTILAESVALADVQKPLDFAFKYGVIDKRYDAQSMLAPSVPMSKG